MPRAPELLDSCRPGGACPDCNAVEVIEIRCPSCGTRSNASRGAEVWCYCRRGGVLMRPRPPEGKRASSPTSGGERPASVPSGEEQT